MLEFFKSTHKEDFVAITRKEELVNTLAQLGKLLLQQENSGGIHTSPASRLLLFAILQAIQAKQVLELGFDAGYTTELLALGAEKVVAIDNYIEYPETKVRAEKVLEAYEGCALIRQDALVYLKTLEDSSLDLVFVDDKHEAVHIREEAVEINRVVRLGGFAVFHDVNISLEGGSLGAIVSNELRGWERIFLPCISPALGENFGIGLYRRI